jgi:hypothetical protein
MPRQSLLSVVADGGIRFALVLSATFVMAQANPSPITIQPNLAKGPGINVEAKQVIPYNSPQNPLYKISYTYKFDGRSTVFIDGGPGTVPSAGQFTYLTRTLMLKFLDSPDGTSILSLPLQVTFVPAGVPAGEASEDAPKESEFPSVGKEGDWNGTSTDFKAHLNKVLTSLDVPYGFCSAQDQCVITAYKSVDFAALHREQGEVAVKIVYGDRSGKAHFRIYSKAQEKLSHGSWLEPEQVVVEAADGFVKHLLEQLGS